ncbi:MAG: hypothetical protein IJ766_11160 [Clostridia bacterium]|nr:hypothetical protein [Clostridia bacterium]MBR1812184.1 hypothetical protein [Clostridia bacterium]
MAACTFFGHRNTPEKIMPVLESTLTDLIVNKGVKTFFVGNNGDFDKIVRQQLKSLSAHYDIEYFVVFAYLHDKMLDRTEHAIHTVFPDGLEFVPHRFAIVNRNKWLHNHADYVVTYVTHSWGGAAQFKVLAEKNHKCVIELSGLPCLCNKNMQAGGKYDV